METLRYAHFHKNGTLTARLEISVPDGVDMITDAAADAPGKAAKGRRQRRGKRDKPRKTPPASGALDFIRRHSRRVREAFEGAVSSSADAAYERMRECGRAYRYRPAFMRAEYRCEKKGRKTTLSVSVSASLGRQILPVHTERHRFFCLGGGEIYLGQARG